MKRVSLQSRINAVEALIGYATGANRAPKRDDLDLVVNHARQAASALNWLMTDPEAQALMKAQAERSKTAGGAI